jgi:enolase
MTVPEAYVSSVHVERIDALTVLDSRGAPTIRVIVRLSDGSIAAATAPSGASTGKNERAELRDGGKQFHGRGVEHAIANIRTKIAPLLYGTRPYELANVDQAMIDLDGTPDRSHLGANAMVAVSMAVARAAAASQKRPLWRYLSVGRPGTPIPLFNVINGGAHASGGLRIQECMIVPHGLRSTSDCIRCGAEVYTCLRTRFTERHLSTSVGDEGGFVYSGAGVEEALVLLTKAVEDAGYRPGIDASIAIDAAANGFYNGDGTYSPDAHLRLSSDEFCDWWRSLVQEHPIVLLEDPLAEDDIRGWQRITEDLGDRITIVGDDVFVTDAQRIANAVRVGVGNAALLKPNQIGTVSETIAAWDVANEGGFKTVVSHRSGETCDAFITDLAVALGADFLKAGAPARGERTEKYNRLLEIERERNEY